LPRRSERGVRRRSQLIAGAEVGPGALVLEIGAGSGIPTRELADPARRVVAIELDPQWAARLRQERDSHPRVRILEGDALRLDLPEEPFRVIASVPFNRTTAILHHLLDDAAHLVRADLIVQWEVARKRTAIEYGELPECRLASMV